MVKKRVTVVKLRPGNYEIRIGGKPVEFAFSKSEAEMKAKRLRNKR